MQEVFSSHHTEQLKETIGTRLGVLLNAFTSALLLAGMGVVAGLLLKFMHLTGEHLVFIFSLSALAFFLFLQIGISLIFIYRHLPLALLGAFTSLSVGMACLAFVFLFENWWGSFILVFLTLPLYLLDGLFLLAYFFTGQHRHMAHRKYLYLNIVLPYMFTLLIAALYGYTF